MSNWDNWTTDNAQKGTGGDWPEIPDDLYTARIMDVSEPETGPDMFNPGKERTQFYLTWELEPNEDQQENGCEDGTTIRQYLSIPAGMKNGTLNEKAKLYELMSALGFDLEGTFKFKPMEWVGAKARVLIENRANQAGEIRPRVTKVQANRKGGGAGTLRAKVSA